MAIITIENEENNNNVDQGKKIILLYQKYLWNMYIIDKNKYILHHKYSLQQL